MTGGGSGVDDTTRGELDERRFVWITMLCSYNVCTLTVLGRHLTNK